MGGVVALGSRSTSILPILRAMRVLPHPGAPKRSTPRTCISPILASTEEGYTRDANARRKMSPASRATTSGACEQRATSPPGREQSGPRAGIPKLSRLAVRCLRVRGRRSEKTRLRPLALVRARNYGGTSETTLPSAALPAK